MEPGPELRGLHEAILRQDAALELEPDELPDALRAGAAAALVGRDRELAWLRARWERARAGAGGRRRRQWAGRHRQDAAGGRAGR